MAMLLQHNWTGRLAIFAAFPSAAPALSLSMPVKGVNPSSSKGSGRGAWLKSSHARLRLHTSEGQACTLALHLQDTVLLSSQLSDAQLRLGVLQCEQTSVLLLEPRVQDPSSAAPMTYYCFAFFDQADCDGFTAALHAMLAKQQQQQQQQQQAGAAEAAPQLAGGSGSEQQAEAKAAVKRFLLDPDFQRLVDQVDAIWDEVEAELAAADEAGCVDAAPPS